MQHHIPTPSHQLNTTFPPLLFSVVQVFRKFHCIFTISFMIAVLNLLCQLKRSMESDLEKIALPLVLKTGETNRSLFLKLTSFTMTINTSSIIITIIRFLREDCNIALDRMVENVSPSRVIAIVTSEPITNKNPVIRTTVSRLLAYITDRQVSFEIDAVWKVTAALFYNSEVHSFPVHCSAIMRRSEVIDWHELLIGLIASNLQPTCSWKIPIYFNSHPCLICLDVQYHKLRPNNQ